MVFKFSLILSFSLIVFSSSFFEGKTPVILLNGTNFDEKVVQSKDIWLILFYAPWCGHCQRFSPEYEKAAKALKGIFKIGAVDADKEKGLAGKYGIKGFPTVKFFGIHKDKPVDYNSQRTAQAVIDFMFEKAKAITNARLGIKKQNDNKNTQSDKTKKQEPKNEKANDGSDVVVLNDSNFDDTINNSPDMWMVAFYAPWCGHCKALLPEWNIAATNLKGQVKIAKVDATQEKMLASRYQIQGYPTIKIFSPGKDKKVEDYQGPRDAPGIVSFALDKLEKFGFIPETPQLIGKNVLKEQCEDRVGVCVIIFLPNIADSSKKERENYLSIIQEVKKASRGKPIYYLWAQGGDHFEFEEKLNLSFGYPAVVAINYKKKIFSIFKSSFNKQHLTDYISNLLLGKERLGKLPQGLKLNEVKKWDANDYVAPKEEL